MINTHELIQQLQSKSNKIQERIEQTKRLSSTNNDFFSKAADILKKNISSLSSFNFKDIKEQFTDIFEEVFTSELLVRAGVPNIIPYSIMASGKKAKLNGDILASSYTGLRDILSRIREMTSFDFDGVACRGELPQIKSKIDQMLSLNLNYRIPDVIISDYDFLVETTADGYWDPSYINELSNSSFGGIFPIFESLNNAYNLYLDRHSSSISSLQNSNMYARRNSVLNTVRRLIEQIMENCAKQQNSDFPFPVLYFNNYSQVFANVQSLQGYLPFLQEAVLPLSTPEIDLFNTQKQGITPIDIGETQEIGKAIKRILSIIYGAAGQSYNLSSKSSGLIDIIDATFPKIDTAVSTISSNAFDLAYDFDEEFKKDMKELTSITEHLGFDNFSDAMGAASWQKIDLMTPDTVTIYGDLAAQVQDQAAENMVYGRLYAQVQAEKNKQMLFSITYEDSVEQAKKDLEEHKEVIDNIMKAYKEVSTQ